MAARKISEPLSFTVWTIVGGHTTRTPVVGYSQGVQKVRATKADARQTNHPVKVFLVVEVEDELKN